MTEGYASASDHFADELRLVQMLVLRALNRGAARGWLPNDAPTVELDELAAEFRRVDARIAASDLADMPMEVLRRRLGLEITEQRVLWTLVAYELDPMLRRMIRRVASEDIASVTTGTLMTIVYEDTARARLVELLSEGALLDNHLVELEPSDRNASFSQRRIRVTDRVLELACGTVRLDPAIAAIARMHDEPKQLAELELSSGVVARLATGFEATSRRIVLAHGRASSGRRSTLHAIAARRDLPTITVDCRRISPDREVAQRELQIISRECRLMGAVPLLCHLDALAASGDLKDRIDLVDRAFDDLVLATSTSLVARQWDRSMVAAELGAIDGGQRQVLWTRALPPASAGDAAYLATAYPLAPGLIDAVGKATMASWNRSAAMTSEDFAVGIQSVLDDRLSGLATRLTVTQDWKDLVLPEDQTFAMLELLARIRERRTVYEEWKFAERVGKGLGVSALFSGPPGTGKSMAAALIARSLDLEIYQVDLSRIVSKWIGETEKNLAALFSAAEAGHAILLFDEADALFGKRTQVQSSNDRHANQETNYLLQRIEQFAGICILTTNHETSIDDAFRRRIACHVKFPLPDADEREQLWTRLLTGTAPIAADLDLASLARTFVMSGGYIRNAVLRSAFMAADARTEITQPLLLRAAQLEYEAMGKIVAA